MAYLSGDICNRGFGDNLHTVNASITRPGCFRLLINGTGRSKNMFVGLCAVQMGVAKQKM